MKFNAMVRNDERNNGLYALLIFLLIIGIIAGSVFLAKNSTDMGEGIKNYIGNFFSSFTENRNNINVFKNSVTSNLLCLGIIFFMGFFRFGFLVTGAILIRKGFIMGFTTASFLKFYGVKGMLVMLSTMPAVVITIPAMVFFAAISVKFSLDKEKKQKKLIISYIFFLFLMISIFCVASLAEGFLTTTFMSWISPIISQNVT